MCLVLSLLAWATSDASAESVFPIWTGPMPEPLHPLPSEVRAFWVVRHDLAPTTTGDASRIAVEAARSGANTLFVQVSGRGDAWYRSDRLPRAEGLPADAEDPFALLIAAAREHDLSIHAWVNAGLVWSKPRRPRSDDHLVNRNDAWLQRLPDGTAMIDVPTDSLRAWKVEGTFAELALPAVRHHVGEVVREIASRYDIDGIHLDYIRRPNVDTGYAPEVLEIFEDESGMSADDLLAVVERRSDRARPWAWPEYSSDQPTAEMARWNRFRRDSVTRTVRWVRGIVDEVRHRRGRPLLLSAAVIPEPQRARSRYAQDWPSWLDDGLLDFAVPMCYARGRRRAEASLQAILAEADAERLVVGVACYNQPLEDAVETLTRFLDYPVRGACLFSFGSLEAEAFAGVPLVREAWLGDQADAAPEPPPAVELGRGGDAP